MKKVIITMLFIFAFVVWPFSGIWQFLSRLIGGGVQASFIYPIYGGIILLSGLIVGCTEFVIEEMKSPKEELEKSKRDKH